MKLFDRGKEGKDKDTKKENGGNGSKVAEEVLTAKEEIKVPMKEGDKVRLLPAALHMPGGRNKIVRSHVGQVGTVERAETRTERVAMGENGVTLSRSWYRIRFDDGHWIEDIEEVIPPFGIKLLERV